MVNYLKSLVELFLKSMAFANARKRTFCVYRSTRCIGRHPLSSRSSEPLSPSTYHPSHSFRRSLNLPPWSASPPTPPPTVPVPANRDELVHPIEKRQSNYHHAERSDEVVGNGALPPDVRGRRSSGWTLRKDGCSGDKRRRWM